MMKLAMTVLCVIMMMIVPASGVFAYSVNVGDSIVLQNGPGTTGGGEFIVTDTTTGATFTTFCLETDEYISFGTTYKVGGITDSAIAGGSNTPPGDSDPLDPMTAYLYYNFAMGTLTGYNDSGTDAEHAASANALQRAIWFIEGELGNIELENLKGLDEAAYNFVILATNSGWTDIGNVRVMNLVGSNDSLKQDQLILVPEPCTLLLLGAGLIGVGLLRKRFKR